MSCEVTSWIPNAVATALGTDRSAEPVIAWLTLIRASIEEYDPLVTVRTPSPEPENTDTSSTTPDSAFDDILSQLGKEIYKLNEYQRNLIPSEKQDVSLSILNLFDECLEDMCDVSINYIENYEKEQEETKFVEENLVNGCKEYSDDSTLSESSLVTSTPAKCVNVTVNDINTIFDKGKGTPIPPRRGRLKTISSTSSCYDNMDLRANCNQEAKRLDSSDSESTCWSYKECSSDNESDVKNNYAVVWSHSSGYHNSDEILRRVISGHYATVSRLSFDTTSEFVPPRYSIYALQEVGDRCVCDDDDCLPVAVMTPDKPIDDGYEPVRDALTDENIYEDIDNVYSYTDEGCSCGGSVEVESCSISASSEYAGRESPLYANLQDHQAYAIPADVIFWKNLLLDPYFNDDEEDEWITPEECAVYSREQRPALGPLVIPRITAQYRTPRREPRLQHPVYNYLEESIHESRQYEPLQQWSPSCERVTRNNRGIVKASSDSPPFPGKLDRRLGTSTENLLSARRPHHLQLPPSSSGDSLDVEVREREIEYGRSRKSRSMVAPKQRKSPVPAPRMLPQTGEAPVVLEGPVKRTRFMEGGKKSKKNWIDCYLVLTNTALVFYRDQKTYQATKVQRPPGTPPSPTAPRAELILALQNPHIVPCLPTHTRRFTRSLMLTVGYDQYLLQDETEEGIKNWLVNIQNVIYRLGPPVHQESHIMQQHYQSSNTDLESLSRTPPVSRHASRTKPKAGGSSNEDLSDSTEKSHVKNRLRKLLTKRPSKEVLFKKGILKDEPVFGRNLEEVCPPTSPRVPQFVVACIKEIESNEENMCTDGLYRASGNLSQVQKIRLEVDQNNMKVIEENSDIHVLTGSLKLFFRELKEPIIPYKMFDRVLAACSIKPKEAKIKEFRDIIQSLPQCNRDTLKFLLEHLLRVTKYSERNRMHTANLAIVFGPTLLWAPDEQAHNIAIDCIQQNNVVDILLNEFKEIFCDGKKKA